MKLKTKFLCLFLLINTFLFIVYNNKINELFYFIKKNYENLTKLNDNIQKEILKKNINQENFSKLLDADIFNEATNLDYIHNQIKFCQNINKYNNSIIEKKTKVKKIDLYNVSFNMLVYQSRDIVSNSISDRKCYDPQGTKNILDSLDFYAKKKKILKNDIFIIDIGANIGWFSLYLGKVGYKIMAFEPSNENYYILKKNFCLNQDINVTIINRGLYTEDKNCILYHHLSNIGNAKLLCDGERFDGACYFAENIKLTKLSNYIPYFKDKNLALIKIDAEGSEGKAIESGIELIIKYHVPFIYMELTPKDLTEKKTDPKLFLEMFEKNGYKFNKNDFLSQNYIAIEELLKFSQINIYIIYIQFLK